MSGNRNIGTMLRGFAWLGVMATVCVSEAAVQVTPGSAETVAALSSVALSGDASAAAALEDRLFDPHVSQEQWRRDFQTYFGTGAFTASLGHFWEEAYLLGDDDERPHVALVSALCACEAVKAALPHAAGLPAAYDSLVTAFQWLQYALTALDDTARATTLDALAAAIGNSPLQTLARQPRQYAFYVQSALTVAEYAGARKRDVVGRMLGLGPGALAIWNSFGILLFDNGALSEQHVASLGSLLRAIPRSLHRIGAIVVPDATGIAPGTAFVTSVQIVYLPMAPMNVYTAPAEFIDNRGPIAPQFTTLAAQEIVRAVEQVQFALRPALAARRDIILANAQQLGARYLRRYQIVNPVTYMNNPDELLPALAYIYVIDSRTVFQQALGLFQLSQEEPIDQFLLMADLLSGGGSTAPLLATSLQGQVVADTATIGRVHGNWIRPPNAGKVVLYNATPGVPVDLWFCNAIAYQNSRYAFAFDDRGITVRYIR